MGRQVSNIRNGGRLCRRDLIRYGLAGSVGALAIAACGETVIERVEVPVEVIKEVQIAGETIIKEVEVEVAGETVTKIVEVQVEVPVQVGNIELEVWYNQQRGGPGMHGIWNQAALNFQANNPNVRVSVTPFAHGDMEVKVLTAVAGGTAPDVAYLHMDWAATFASKQVVIPLDDYTKSSDIMDDIYPSAVASFQGFGRTWGLPVVSQPQFVLYNQNVVEPLGLGDPWDLFQKGEFTSDWYDGYLAAARTGEGVDSVYGAYEYGSSLLKVQYLTLWGHNSPVWNEDMTESALHSDEAAAGWNWIAGHVISGLVPSRSEQSAIVGGAGGLFNSGKLGMNALFARQNNQKYAEATRRGFAASGYEPINLAIAPPFSWPNGDTYYRDGGNGYGVLQSSENPDAAYELLLELTESVGRGHMGLGLSIPAKKSLANAEEFIGSFHPWEQERTEVFDIIQTDETPAFVQPPRYTEIQTMVRTAYDEIVLGEVEPQNAMGDIKSRIDEILQEAPEGMRRSFPGDL